MEKRLLLAGTTLLLASCGQQAEEGKELPLAEKGSYVWTVGADAMQQLWDKLRRKVSDVQSKLPAGAGPSVVNDDFGDVLGVFYSLSSDTRTYRELEYQD